MQGDSLSEPSAVTTAAWLVIKIVVVVGIPLIVERIASALVARLAPPDFTEVPVANAPPRLFGLVLGLVLVYDRYGWPSFDVQELFVPGGPWDLSLWQFLTQPANPFNYGIASLHAFAADRSDSGAVIPVIVLLGFLMLATVLSPFAIWSNSVARRAVLGNLVRVIAAAYLTIYAVVLLFWLLHLLNFWTFALLVAIFQYYRSRA
jgi:hypothetical protein